LDKNKLEKLLLSKNFGVQVNPNNLILNLTSKELSNDQYNALQYGLKFGIATLPRLKPRTQGFCVFQKPQTQKPCASAESVSQLVCRRKIIFYSLDRGQARCNPLLAQSYSRRKPHYPKINTSNLLRHCTIVTCRLQKIGKCAYKYKEESYLCQVPRVNTAWTISSNNNQHH
jgi:hypothetical protein